jgi:hypothetical protein
MSSWKSVCSALGTLTVCLIASSASASTIEFSLALPDQTADAGDIVSFIATITAPSTNLSPVYLNADAHTEDAGLVVDDTGFFVNFPLVLMPGDSTTAVLFAVNVTGGAGAYDGFFDILGGQDVSQLELQGSTSYSITVTSVPEPGGMWLAATGALGLLRTLIRRN